MSDTPDVAEVLRQLRRDQNHRHRARAELCRQAADTIEHLQRQCIKAAEAIRALSERKLGDPS